MGHKTNNLHTFTIGKEDIRQGLISLFDMDEDYNGGNGDEYWGFSDQEDEDGNPISLAVLGGFETEAERFVDNIWNEEADKGEEPNAHKMITSTLYKVEECHGDHSSQFNFSIVETDFQFVVAVSYLT
tara:strand:- start:735 stop:1118 length:384 start_codon:yes stop_codon:yes gene_type:complete